MNGMVLAAGYATRLAPLSAVVPKPALDVLGRPLLAAAVAQLRRAGCDRIVVNLHYLPERVAAAARACDSAALFSWEPELLGGAGGVAAARPSLGAGAVLVANADVHADLDLAPLLACTDPRVLTLALRPHPDPRRWSSVVLEASGAVREILPAGAPGAGERYLFTGFQLLGTEVVAELPPPPAEMAALWASLRRRGALRGAVVEGAWREVGTPSAYAALIRALLAGRTWVHPQATLAGDARVARSAVGAGCRIGAGAVVEDSVLTAGAAAGDGAELCRCVAAGPLTVAGPHADALITPSGATPL